MKIGYLDFVEQSFDFPQGAFGLEKNQLTFHGISLAKLVEKYGTPLKLSYLPSITNNINEARNWFNDAMVKVNYQGKYNYCFCTKSSHFSFVMDTVLKNDVHLETSSAFDINIIQNLHKKGKIKPTNYIICNGYKLPQYLKNIVEIINDGFENVILSVDNTEELHNMLGLTDKKFKVGIRIASEEEPKFAFYTSRLGIGYKEIVPFYKKMIANNEQLELKMLNFFINTGIKDNAYYWNELNKCVSVYCNLKKICPELTTLNIGGGFPVKNSLAFEYDYAYMIEEIITQIKQMCNAEGVDEPDIFTEFGTYTVGESGATIYTIVDKKQQNEKEKWSMINSSFMTTLPDAWAINKRFIMLPINNWDKDYERTFLGGITCDSEDYYNSEQHLNAIYLPKYDKNKPLHIGFFHTGAYQESLAGYGGIQHCLIPAPKHVIVDYDKDGKVADKLFAPEQSHESMLDILGYE